MSHSLDFEAIAALCPRNRLHYFASIGSTMTEAVRLAESGAPHGTAVLTDEQTAGVGRLGRSWNSQAGLGIYCSIVLRLKLPPQGLPIASLLLGLATAEAIEKSTDLTCDLRWPNDVLINGRKVAGILAHLTGDCIVAGIGINANQQSFESGFRTPPTSLRIETGRIQPREPVIAALLASVETFCALLAEHGKRAIIRVFTSASSYAVARRVEVEESGAKGITAGLDEDGFLLLRDDSGALHRISSGGIRPDRERS